MIEVEVNWPGREMVRLVLQVDSSGNIIEKKLTGIGGPDFLSLLVRVRETLKGPLKLVIPPSGNSPAEICLREVILKAKGEWDYPYKEAELCHCRVVATSIVDQAICLGAHTARKVSELTSASTACGTCRPVVEELLAFRLK